MSLLLGSDCDIDMARKICTDSKTLVCNSVERILVHAALAKDGRVSLASGFDLAFACFAVATTQSDVVEGCMIMLILAVSA